MNEPSKEAIELVDGWYREDYDSDPFSKERNSLIRRIDALLAEERGKWEKAENEAKSQKLKAKVIVSCKTCSKCGVGFNASSLIRGTCANCWMERCKRAEKERDALQYGVKQAIINLHECGRIFKHYAFLHTQKSTPEADEKSKINNQNALMCEQCISELNSLLKEGA